MALPNDSTILTVRIPADLNRRLGREAKRRRLSRSQATRAILESALGGAAADFAAEARRQSLLASGRRSERDIHQFIGALADESDWR